MLSCSLQLVIVFYFSNKMYFPDFFSLIILGQTFSIILSRIGLCFELRGKDFNRLPQDMMLTLWKFAVHESFVKKFLFFMKGYYIYRQNAYINYYHFVCCNNVLIGILVLSSGTS